ncbi:MAG: hypothetical protein M1816_005236 [Peltula sp. TS41687]|nr:MAG: hypothetical protein M1816_005236 [Peltula sp. TS41687]
MPVLRSQVENYVRTWNRHTIRKQNRRPNSVPGKPIRLYFYPPKNTSNCGLQVDRTLLAGLQADVEAWDPFEYLPKETLQWCQGILDNLNSIQADLDGPFPLLSCTNHWKYLELKKAVKEHMQNGGEPLLAECNAPVGGYQWQPTSESAGIRTEAVRTMDITGEGPEEMDEEDPALLA